MYESFLRQTDLKGDLLGLRAWIGHVAQHLGGGVPQLDFGGHMEFCDCWVGSLGHGLGGCKREKEKC